MTSGYFHVGEYPDWVEYTVSEKIEIKETLTDIGNLYFATSATIDGFHSDTPPFPSLQPEIDSREAFTLAPYLIRGLFEIGTWRSPTGVWQMSLLLLGPTRNPFAPIYSHDLLLLTKCTAPDALGRELRVRANIRVCLIEPNTPNTVGAPRIVELGKMKEMHFHHADAVKVHFLDLERWRRSLGLWSGDLSHETCVLCFEIAATTSATRHCALWGIGYVLQRQPELLELVADHLTLPDLRNLRATSRRIREVLITKAERRMCDVLRPYFELSAVPAFCAALYQGHALLSGSTVLSVLCPGEWTPNDLDIVIPFKFGDRFIDFLRDQGYTEHETATEEGGYPGSDEPSYGSFSYKCFLKGDGADARKIDLCLVHLRMTPVDFLLTYHSTAVMNFYNGDKICCLFPDLTFHGRFMLNSCVPTQKLEMNLAKVRERGYVEKPTPEGGRYMHDWLPHDEASKRVKAKDLPRTWSQTIVLT